MILEKLIKLLELLLGIPNPKWTSGISRGIEIIRMITPKVCRRASRAGVFSLDFKGIPLYLQRTHPKFSPARFARRRFPLIPNGFPLYLQRKYPKFLPARFARRGVSLRFPKEFLCIYKGHTLNFRRRASRAGFLSF